jgi:hypothetical protein
MNDDYLWDKSGDDAEIKRLEETLAVFRYQETAAPAVEQATESNNGRFRWRFSFALAFAASVAIAITGGTWLWQSDNLLMQDGNLIAAGSKTEPQNATKAEISTPPTTPEISTAPATQVNVTQSQKREPVRVVHRASPRKTKKLNYFAKRTDKVELTREEKNAYDQVLLALSITSSKLKIVQDKVNGVENSTPPMDNNNR